MSIHELNTKSHLLKSQGRQIITTTTQDEIDANLDYNLDEFAYNNGNNNNVQRSINDNNNNNSNKIVISYMDNMDTTSDYYYSGSINDKKRLINGHTGHIQIMSYPAYTHASLPISLLKKNDSFAISIWIHLLPIDDWETTSTTTTTTINNDGVGGRRPRVILSTSNGGNGNDNRNEEVAEEEGGGGCRSNILGESLVTGLVLYVQPHYDDASDTDSEDDDNETAYRVILEYNNRVSTSSSSSCHTIIGTHQLLIKVGHWHHVALFVSSTRPSSGVDEDEGRISLYVDGYLAGRKDNTPLPRYYTQQQSKLIVGRHAPPIVDSASYSSSGYAYYLDGRVGMLSFWETSTSSDSVSSSSSNTKSITTTRMQIKSKIDEDHVVRAVNRCAFDIRAITELSLQGLGVKEPTLLYTFDGQKKRDNVVVAITDLLYSESSGRRVAVVVVREFISGRMDGEIISEQVDHGGGMATTVHERQPFVPLGGNRYAEYKDGTYIPRLLKTSERRELNEIAHARSILVKKAMQHAWNGYTKFAYGKDELLPLSQEGQDNWGGMATTLIDSLRQVKKCVFFCVCHLISLDLIFVLVHCG